MTWINARCLAKEPPLDKILKVRYETKPGSIHECNAVYNGNDFQDHNGYFFYQMRCRVLSWWDESVCEDFE